MLIRRPDYPKELTWDFQGSRFLLTKENGTFEEMQAVCASFGMYIWLPNSHEKLSFVEQEILRKLSPPYKTFNVWIGVHDKPNGNCRFPDKVTKCPITKYYGEQPKFEREECVHYHNVSGELKWNDVICGLPYFALCESK